MLSTPFYPMVLLIIIPFLNGYHYPYEKWLSLSLWKMAIIIGNINPTFSGPNPPRIRVARCPTGVDIAGREAGAAPRSWRQSHGAQLIGGRAVGMTQRKTQRYPKMFLYIFLVGTKSQEFHKNSKKYAGRGLGLALRPCLEKSGRVKVCLESWKMT